MENTNKQMPGLPHTPLCSNPTTPYPHNNQVACGAAHTVAIVDVRSGPRLLRGQLWTWGAGLASTGAPSAPCPSPRFFNFTKTGHQNNVAEQVACGDQFTAVLDEDGKITIIGLSPITGKVYPFIDAQLCLEGCFDLVPYPSSLAFLFSTSLRWSDYNTTLYPKETNQQLDLPDDFYNDESNRDFKDIEVSEGLIHRP